MRAVRGHPHRQAAAGWWASHWKEAAATALLLVSTQLQDLAALWGNNEAAWTAWLTLNQVCLALVCLAAAVLLRRRWRIYLVMAALWFTAQALDELLFGNSIMDGRWEYLALVVYALLVHRIVQHFVPHEPGRAEHGVGDR